MRGNSFSGHERNRLFLATEGNFEDATLNSGADFMADGRGFALLDYNQDGWVDMAAMCCAKPKLRLLENKFAKLASVQNHKFVQIRLIGGNQGSAQSEWSPRDAFGATMLVRIGETKRMFTHLCSEGLSSQNSAWRHIGLGESAKIDQIEITWPSGKKTIETDIAAGTRLVIFENPKDQK